jgi:hypothetical protein
MFTLALSRRLFVSLTRAQLGQETSLLDSALKATHRCFEGFVFADFDNHVNKLYLVLFAEVWANE